MRTVNQAYYTKEYFLHECSNFAEFARSKGTLLGDRFQVLLPYLDIKPKMNILDIGSGRGEMCIFAATRGATAVGVDYSKAAIEIAEKAVALQSAKIQKRVSFIRQPVIEMNFKPRSFDYIISCEVLEHLYPEEIEVMLKKVKTYLKPGGKIIFHTAPNAWFNNFTYPYFCYPVGSLLIRLWNKVSKRTYPALLKPEKIHHKTDQYMHINEPTYFSLKHQFDRAGLRSQIFSTNVTVAKPVLSWKDRLYNSVVFLLPLSKRYPVNVLWGNDFVILAI